MSSVQKLIPIAQVARRLLVVFFSVLTASYGLAQVDSLSVPAMDSLSAVPAQSDSVLLAMDSTAATTVEAAALVIPKRPFNIGIHVDYGKILTLPFPFEYKVEGGLTLEFLERIELVGELGYWEKDARRAIDNGTYTSTGMYLRAGAGFIVPFNQPGSQIGLGFRYGISNFSDEGRYEISETGGLIEPFASSFSRDNLSATWMSGVLTSMSSLKIRKALPDARINRVFKIGLMLRYRFLIGWDRRLSPDDPIDVFTIPGFGRTLSQRNLALNAFIRIYPFGY